MIVVMQTEATQDQIQAVVAKIRKLGLKEHLSAGEKKTIIGVVGFDKPVDPQMFQILPGVENVVRILKPFKLASREFKKKPP